MRFSYVCAYFVPDARLNDYIVAYCHVTAYSHTITSTSLNRYTVTHIHIAAYPYSFSHALASAPASYHTLVVAVST